MRQSCLFLSLLTLSGFHAVFAVKVDLLGHSTDDIVPDEYLIHFHPQSRHHFDRASESFYKLLSNATKMGTFSRTDKMLLLHARMDAYDLRKAELLDGVQAIYPNVIYRTQQSFEKEVAPRSWGLDRIDQEDGLDNTFTWQSNGSNVGIAILDTGIDTSHSDWDCDGTCTSRAVFLADCHNADPCNRQQNPFDPEGHGTHVAGIAGSNSYGVARGATIYAVRVLGPDGTGVTSDIIRGIELVEDHAAVNTHMRFVINLSLGGGRDPTLNAAVEEAYRNNIVVVAAAGNENGVNACNLSPAGAARVITVGATTVADLRSSFTNLGPCVDIFAPGTGIRSLAANAGAGDDPFRVLQGTSMAAPHVAGVAAMILSANPSLNSADVEGILVEVSAKDLLSDIPADSPNRLLQIPVIDEMTIPAATTAGEVTSQETTRFETPEPSNPPECLAEVDEDDFDEARRWYGAMFDITIDSTGNVPVDTAVRITRLQITANEAFQDETLEVYVTRDRISFQGNEENPDPWERLALIRGVDASRAGEVLDFDIGALAEWDLVIPPEQFGQPIGVYVTLMNMNAMRYYFIENEQSLDLTLVDDSILTVSGGVGVEYPWTMFVGPRYFAGSLCYELVSTILPEPVETNTDDIDGIDRISPSDSDVYLGKCLASVPSSNAGNTNNGVMFDLTVPEDLIDGAEVMLDNILLGVTDMLAGATIEVYTTVGAWSYQSIVNQSSAWTLLGRIENVQSTEAGSIVDFGMALDYALPEPGQTRGFYVTFTEENPSMLYYNVPDRGVFAQSDGLIVSGGVGVSYPFNEVYEPRQFSGSVCYRVLLDGEVIGLSSVSSASHLHRTNVFAAVCSLFVLALAMGHGP